ncbi:MAG: PspC domain-containing protein, partial [Planctomycetota bacterium]|nr:PspC domain-containing protein [Planctomycetota bacterium]
MNSQQRRQGLYRSRGGIIMGVCQGIAEHWDFSVFWTRLVFVLT